MLRLMFLPGVVKVPLPHRGSPADLIAICALLEQTDALM